MAYRGRWAWERRNHTGKAPRDQRRTVVIPVFLPTMGGWVQTVHLPLDRMSTNTRYRVSFVNQGRVYEVFARAVHQDGLYGFVTVEGLLFGERSQVVVDPSEDRLRREFEGVERFHIPLHSLIRIDEVATVGSARIRDAGAASGNVHAFPGLPGSGPGRPQGSPH